MKRFAGILAVVIISLSLLSLFSCCECKKGKESGKTFLTGKNTWTQWQKRSNWKDFSAKNYSPDEEIVGEIKSLISQYDNLSFIVVSAEWCPDSKSETPKIYKLLEEIGVKFETVPIYGVDRKKSEPTGTAEQYTIKRVPTLIVLANGKELGRIVEYPYLSWEEDLKTIIENK